MTPAQHVFRCGAFASAALTTLPAYWAIVLPWQPHADFDVTGILWILQNGPRLTAWVLAGSGVAATVYFAARSIGR